MTPHRTTAMCLAAATTVAAALSSSACAPPSTTSMGPPSPSVDATLAGSPVELDVAADDASRGRGLRGRRKPPDDGEGMLFVFREPATLPFVLKDVPFALDVVFLDEDLRVIAVKPLGPESAEAPPPEGTLYAVELRSGWARDHGLVPGDALELERVPKAAR